MILEYLGDEPPPPAAPYPPLSTLDPEAFLATLLAQADSFAQIVYPEGGDTLPIPLGEGDPGDGEE